ncbi:MAG: phosphoribosyl-ATP diphosphatase [Rhodobacteraceae bacterium]|nr:phosphoribosyl-ATP diphosphatase [Paracoccaceae bacterium]MCY4137464.1 phosphoribosyl-ATP diphosphatase [Paracoccaceae bacterium]
MSDVLTRLARVIESRVDGDPSVSHVASLISEGPRKCTEKFGEEAIEAIVASSGNETDSLVGEAADVMFHLLVMLAAHGIRLEDVLAELERREGKSGIREKQERHGSG